MKTILHVSENVGIGGAETVFVQLATRGSPAHFQNLAALPEPGWAADKLNAAGLAPLHMPISRTRPVVDLGLYRSLVRLIREHDVDLVQSHSLGISVYACLAGLRTRTPVVCTLHGEIDLGRELHGEIDPGREVRGRGIKLRILRRGAAKIVLVSNHLRDKLLAESRIPADRMAVVYNGVDCDRHMETPDRTLRAELGLDDENFLFGAVGNLRTAKAYDNLLRAAAIAVKINPKARFAVVGEGSGPLLEELLRLRRELELQGIVQFVGFRQDVTVPLRNFDAFVMSSRSEGFPIALIQAMASGLPIVATRCGGPEEQVTNEVDGLLVPREDSQALASAMLRIVGDESLRVKLGQAARASARARFSLTKMLSSYEELYRELLD